MLFSIKIKNYNIFSQHFDDVSPSSSPICYVKVLKYEIPNNENNRGKKIIGEIIFQWFSILNEFLFVFSFVIN